MLGDIAHLLDLLWSWISPSEDDQNVLKYEIQMWRRTICFKLFVAILCTVIPKSISFFRPHGDPQMMRFGAHVVLVLRYLLGDELKDAFKEKLTTVGDFIIQLYVLCNCYLLLNYHGFKYSLWWLVFSSPANRMGNWNLSWWVKHFAYCHANLNICACIYLLLNFPINRFTCYADWIALYNMRSYTIIKFSFCL